MSAQLIGLSYSPWTERARWALDHHGIPYQWTSHRPYLGEGALRRRAGLPRGTRATVPLFVDGETVLRDSIDIVRHADAVGRGAPLIRDEALLSRLLPITERGLQGMRGRVTAGILEDREAIREQALDAVPGFLAPLVGPLVERGARFIATKYGARLERDGQNLLAMRETLAALREAVDTSSVPSPETLRIEHVLFATFLQGILPVRAPHIRSRPAMMRVWTTEPLLEEARELLAWRDATYAATRRLPPR